MDSCEAMFAGVPPTPPARPLSVFSLGQGKPPKARKRARVVACLHSFRVSVMFAVGGVFGMQRRLRSCRSTKLSFVCGAWLQTSGSRSAVVWKRASFLLLRLTPPSCARLPSASAPTLPLSLSLFSHAEILALLVARRYNTKPQLPSSFGETDFQSPSGGGFGEAEFQRPSTSFGENEFRRGSAGLGEYFGEAEFVVPGGLKRGGGGNGVPGQQEQLATRAGQGSEKAKGVRALAVVGGVAANQELRRRLQVGGRAWERWKENIDIPCFLLRGGDTVAIVSYIRPPKRQDRALWTVQRPRC